MRGRAVRALPSALRGKAPIKKDYVMAELAKKYPFRGKYIALDPVNPNQLQNVVVTKGMVRYKGFILPRPLGQYEKQPYFENDYVVCMRSDNPAEIGTICKVQNIDTIAYRVLVSGLRPRQLWGMGANGENECREAYAERDYRDFQLLDPVLKRPTTITWNGETRISALSGSPIPKPAQTNVGPDGDEDTPLAELQRKARIVSAYTMQDLLSARIPNMEENLKDLRLKFRKDRQQPSAWWFGKHVPGYAFKS
eukprot:Clim_evm3s32 gene=Clim_evmTU3s32